VQNFIIHIKNQFGKIIKCFRTDNKTKFNYVDMYNAYGINHQKALRGNFIAEFYCGAKSSTHS